MLQQRRQLNLAAVFAFELLLLPFELPILFLQLLETIEVRPAGGEEIEK